MGRKRTELGTKAERAIAELAKRGGTAESIAKALKAKGITGVSARTIGRRMREVRGDVKPKRISASEEMRAEYAKAVSEGEPASDAGDAPLPKSPEAIPQNADLEQLEKWIKRAERVGAIAAAKGDINAIGSMGRLTSALLEMKRRLTPPTPEDPADSPDMQKLAGQVEIRMLKYVEEIVKERALPDD